VRIIKTSVLGVLLLTASLALAQDIKTDYNHTANFSRYRTFMWVKEPQPQNPLMKQRIMDAINAQLQLRELRLVNENADLAISANVATQERHTLQSFYDDFPGWGWHRMWGPGPGYGTVVVDTYEVGTLVVDLFDTHNKDVVWWGSATATVSDKPEKNTKKLDKSVEKMFKDFPPKAAHSER
jgi:hypothetical protein